MTLGPHGPHGTYRVPFSQRGYTINLGPEGCQGRMTYWGSIGVPYDLRATRCQGRGFIWAPWVSFLAYKEGTQASKVEVLLGYPMTLGPQGAKGQASFGPLGFPS